MSVTVTGTKRHLDLNSSTLTTTGNITAGGNILLGDSQYIHLGDNPDLKIYHNGSHSFIQDTGAGDLRLLGSSIKLQNTSEANILTLASDLSATFAGSVTINSNSFSLDGTAPTMTVNSSNNASGFRINVTGLDADGDDLFRAQDSGTTRFTIKRDGDGIFTGDVTVNRSVNTSSPIITISNDDNKNMKMGVVRSAAGTAPNTSFIAYDGDFRLIPGSGNSTEKFTLNSSGNATFASDVGMVTGHSSGKFAVMSTAVHGSYDFYNNGTSYFNGAVTVDDNLTVAGNLTVSGTTTTLNTQTVEVEDNILQLNTTQGSPDTATAVTSGISVYRGDGVTQASLIFDDADDTWDLTNNLVVAGTIITPSTVYVGTSLAHYGDGDTNVTFDTNDLKLKAGGATHFHAASNQATILYSGNSTALTLDTSQNATFAGAGTFETTLNVSATDDGGSPAMTAIMNMHGYDQRGVGIKMKDNVNTSGGGSNAEWFVGTGYSQTGFNIGYASDGSQSSYAAQNKLSISTAGDATFAGHVKLNAGKALRLYNTAGSGWAEVLFNESDNLIQVQRGIVASADSALNLGSSSVRWANVYADTLYGDGSNLTNISSTDSSKLPLAGGTMSGNLFLDDNSGASPYIQFTNGDNNYFKMLNSSSGKLEIYQATTKRADFSSGGLELVNSLTATGLDINGNADISGTTAIGGGTVGSAYSGDVILHTKGSSRSIIQQSSSSDAYYMFGDAGANNAAWVGYEHSNGTLSLQAESAVNINKNTNVSGSVTATSLDINGNGDISGTLTSGAHTINSGADAILTLNQTGTDTGWSYINFNTSGTRNWYIGQDNNKNFDIYNDNTDSLGLSIDYGNNTVSVGTLTWSGGSSTNANTAYGWGNHASAGYLTSHQSISHLAPKASPTFTGDITIPNKIIHSGDTNTYMQFEAADVWRVVTGGTERLDINTNRILVGDGMMMQYDSISTTNSGTVVKGGFLNPASESNMVHIPHVINDLAGFNKWSNATITTSGFYKSRSGSSGSYTYSNEVQANDGGWANAFDAHSSTAGSWYSDNGTDGVYSHGTDTPGVVELEWTNEATYSLWAGIVFGSGSFTPTYVKIEAYRAGAWQTLCEITDNTDQVILRQVSGNSGTNAATRRLKYTLGGSVNNSYFRIHSLYMANYAAGNNNLNNTGTDTTRGVNFLERYKNNYLHGHLYPGADNTYDLGSGSYTWNNVNAVTLNGNLVGTIHSNTTATTQTAGDNTTKVATTAFVGTAVANLVDSAPGDLNTLNELAAALNDDDEFSTTVTTSLGNRVRIDTANQGLDATQKSNARTNIGAQASGNYLTSVAYTDLTGTVPTWNQNTTGSAGSVPYSGITSLPEFVDNDQLINRTTTVPDTAGDGRGITFKYMSGSATNKPTGSDHSLMTMAYNSAWQTQIAQDWRNSGRMYLRGQNNGTWSDWNQVWDSSDFTKASVLNSNITLSSLGAQAAGSYAAASHNHAASEITSGTLSTSRLDSSVIFGNNSSGTNEGNFTNWNDLSKTGFYSDDGATGKWTTSNWSSVMHFKLYDDNNNYASQLGFDTYNSDFYYRMKNNGTWTSWYEVYHEGHKPTWSEIESKPSTFAPSSHNHDDRYYTETEIDNFGFLTSSSTQSKYLRSDANDTTTGSLTIGDGSADTRLIIKRVDGTVADDIQFFNGTTRVGEIGTKDTTWLRINQTTAKNIYTPRYIRADGGFFVDTTDKGINGSGNFIGGTITGASDANVSNWDTAYTHSQAAHAPSDADATPSWVPSSDPGYLTSSSTQSKYLRSDTADTATGKIVLEGNSAAWSTTTPGTATGSLHFDPGVGTDHFGNAITFGASDSSNGTTAQAGIYLRTDGGYGSRMYFATTDSYATGSKVAMYINHNKDVYFLDDIDVSGNIAVGGTVDGRNIATDGTKLDTIATNADVTPSWVPSSNPSYLTGITSSQVTTALGYTPMNSSQTTISSAQSQKLAYITVTQAVDLDSTETRANNGHTAYGWGDHGSAGYLTVSESVQVNNNSGLYKGSGNSPTLRFDSNNLISFDTESNEITHLVGKDDEDASTKITADQFMYQTIVCHFSQSGGSTADFLIPMNHNSEATSAQYYHMWAPPHNGRVETMIMKHGHGSAPSLASTTPTRFRIAKNSTSASYSSSYKTRVRVEGRSDDYYSYIRQDSINFGFNAGDRVYFKFQNSSSSTLWRNCSVSIVVRYNLV